MIKKFYEFIIENISRQEIEDQFLRLTEILHCTVEIERNPDDYDKKLYGVKIGDILIYVTYINKQFRDMEFSYMDVEETSEETKEACDKIYDELICIKNRLEHMYPVTMKIQNRMNSQTGKLDATWNPIIISEK